MRMRTTTDEERDAAQARLESWARGEDTESLRALAEHLAAGQLGTLGRVEVEYYHTTLRTVVDIDMHTGLGVDPRGLAAWFRAQGSQILWDGVWLSTGNADDIDNHITTIRLEPAWRAPDTDPIPAHPEHGPHLHIRESGTWRQCALCGCLYHKPPRDRWETAYPRMMTQLKRAILPGATTHREPTSVLNGLDHDPTPRLLTDDGTVNHLWLMHRAFRVAERNGWTPVEDWIEPAGWTAVFTRGGDTVQISGGPHIRPRQQIELIRDALEDTPPPPWISDT